MTEHMNAEDVLREARTTLENPEAWTRGALARRANGMSTYTRSTYAVSWCLVGAIARAGTDGETQSVAILRLKKVIGKDAEHSIVQWSDNPERTHEEVLAAFDRAIADA